MPGGKVYVHFEPQSGGDACTESIAVEETTTVQDVVRMFARKCAAKGVSISEQAADVADEEGVKLKPSAVVLGAVQSKADLFVSVDSKKAAAAASAKALPVVSQPVAGKPAAAPSVPRGAADVSLDQVVAAAEHLFVDRNFKKLRELTADAMKRKVGGKAEFSMQALACRARLENDHFGDALLAADRMAQLEDASYLAHYLCGRCHIGLGDHEEALLEMQRALSLLGGASKSSARVCADQDKHGVQEIDIRAGEAEALFGLNRHLEAADKLNAVMNNPRLKADDHLPTLHLYAKICLAYAKWPDCVRSLLRAIAANQNDKTSKRLITEMMKAPQAFDEMLAQIPKGPQSAAVYGFLGVIARDESAFPVAIRLLGMAAAAHPANANFALTLIHAHESNNDPTGALEAMKRFLSANGKTRVTYGASPLRQGFSCGDLAGVVDLALNSRLGAIASSDVIRWVPEDTEGKSASGANGDNPNGGYGEVLSADGTEGTHNFEPTDGGNASDKDVAIDILAIAFTAVKILYGRGQLAYLPQLIKIVEPTRRDYQRVLNASVHETAVRNEHAYYLCILQTCAVHCARQLQVDEAASRAATEEPLMVDRWLRNRPETGAEDVVYVCGDSHCMSPAWSNLSSTVKLPSGESVAKTYTLVPKLVTGIKHWHLRPESRFYPKATFWSAMSTIPDGAKVIFMLGEIDCREGLLRAVEKDAYPTLEAAMKHTCGLFAAALRSIASAKPNLKIFVHPVVPVLDPTRKIVIKYNSVLKSVVSSIKGVTWIDIFEPMLCDPIREANRSGVHITGGVSGDTLKLRDSYAFDGTHMHPNYVPLLLEPFMRSHL